MKNKMELKQASEKFAAETLEITDGHALGKKRHELFDTFGISGEHYDEFRNHCENSRQQYLSLARMPLTLAKPAA